MQFEVNREARRVDILIGARDLRTEVLSDIGARERVAQCLSMCVDGGLSSIELHAPEGVLRSGIGATDAEEVLRLVREDAAGRTEERHYVLAARSLDLPAKPSVLMLTATPHGGTVLVGVGEAQPPARVTLTFEDFDRFLRAAWEAWEALGGPRRGERKSRRPRTG
jgi:hypothetical protein